MSEQFLAIADADKIHEYVFSPRELRLIKGGSLLQTRLNKQVLKLEVERLSGKCISANGGTVVAKFDTQGHAETFCNSAESLYRRHTAVATVSTAMAPFGKEQWAQAKEYLDARLEMNKHAAQTWHFGGSSPFWTTCQ